MNTLIEVTDDFIITVKDLKRINACEEAIKFVERNDLEGVRLKDVKGSYECYENWLSAQKFNIFEINSKDQLVTKRDHEGTLIYAFEYDSKGNMVSKIDRYSGKHIYEYDDNGNILSESLEGTYHTCSWGYDNKGNKIFETFGNLKSQYKYDDIGNEVCKIYPSGRISYCKYTRTYEYFTVTKNDREVLKVDLAYKNSKNAKST